MFKAFKKLYQEDKIKAMGVSNYTINHLKEALEIFKELNIPLSVNQVEFHPLLYQKKLMEFCKENKIVITAYSPLAHGHVLQNKTLQDIGKKYNKTAAQISLRWLLDKELAVIPKASSEKHLKENLDVDFRLAKEDNAKIDNLNDNLRTNIPGYAEF
jgi:diketogulonate reductase-like aldo/keto reductase